MYKSPKYLRKGSLVGIISPAGKVPFSEIEQAIKIMESWGVRVKKGNFLFEEYFQFAGTDEQRLQDFQQMLDDQEVEAIICARGGYGTTRIIDKLDFSAFLHHPKWIAGYSDITAVHCHVHTKKIQSIHSIMPLTFAKEDTGVSVESLRKMLFGEQTSYETPVHLLNRKGTTKAPIIGGNLALLASITGTSSDIDTDNKILFVEDINEYLYNIDRMMIQLKRAGKLDKLAGLIVGHFTDVKDNSTPFGKSAQEIIYEAVKEYTYPVAFNFPVGHEPQNLAIACGRIVTFSVEDNKVMLTFEDQTENFI